VPARNLKRIYYLGQSLGGVYGTAFLAVEPSVRAGVLTVSGALYSVYVVLSPVTNRAPIVADLLAARVPSLINPPGLTSIGGVPVAPPYFNENLPLRNQPPVVNTVPGAIEIQEVIEHIEWVMQSDPVAYAPHLRKAPLAGVPEKSVIVQFAKGDQSLTNPATTAMLRAGDLADRATFYRHERAFAEDLAVPRNPHGFLFEVTSPIPLMAAIARGAQEQIAVFLASDGSQIIHPEPMRFFEVPIRSPLPEDLNFIP
jgi:hypothetical protein